MRNKETSIDNITKRAKQHLLNTIKKQSLQWDLIDRKVIDEDVYTKKRKMKK